MLPLARLASGISTHGKCMNLLLRKRLITGAAVAVAASGLALLAAGFAFPIKVSSPTATLAPRAASRPAEVSAGTPQRTGLADLTLGELQALCATDLHRPLFDPPGAAASQGESPSATPLTLQLLGTIDEPGHSVAIFLARDGSIRLCSPGESLDDAGGPARLLSVEHQKATVLYAGQRHDLVMPPVP